MYKIMLADDEGIVIDAMKFIIEKEFGEECEIAFAKTGRSVIELAEQFRPDIAIMDIQMPGINGIEAMKEIRKTNKNVIFIVSSAYDKFDYATQAIRLGVLEYITKPLERTKLVSVLRKAMELVDKERSRRSNDLMVKEKLETVVPIIESGLIYNLLLQDSGTEEIENYKTMLGIETAHAYMIALIYGDSKEGNHMTNAVGSSVKMQKYYKDVREVLKDSFPCIVGTLIGNKIPVLVPVAKEALSYSERIELIDHARAMIRQLQQKTDIIFRAGIGGVKELSRVSDSYNAAIGALAMTTGSVAHSDDLPIGCAYEKDYPVHMENAIFDAVEKGALDDAVYAAGTYFDWMAENNPNSLMEIRTKVLEFTLFAERTAYLKGGMTYQFGSRKDYLPTLMGYTVHEEIKKWFVDKIMEACRNVSGKRAEKSNHIIEQAKEYIRKHFNKDISLDDVSRVVNISPYYFSKIFKEDTGVNFIEYVTGIRIDKAKELLMHSDYTMKEIGIMVGYTDPNYFSRSFKKNVGVTPTEFKEGKMQGGEEQV